MIIKANQEETNEILKYAAQSNYNLCKNKQHQI